MTRFAKALRDEVRERGSAPVTSVADSRGRGTRRPFDAPSTGGSKARKPEPDAYCALVAFLHLDGLAALGELELLAANRVFDECKTGSEE